MKSLQKAHEQFKRVLILLAGFSFVVNILLLTMPLYMLQIYDRVLPSQSMATLTFLTVIALSSLIVLGMLEAVRSVIASRAAAKLEATLGSDAMRASLHAARLGEADVRPIRDLAAVRSFVSSRLAFSLLDLPFAPLFIFILYIVHPILFWLTAFGAAVLFGLAWANQKATNEAGEQSVSRQNSALTSAQAFSRNAHTIKSMGMAQNAIAAWGAHNSQSLIAQDMVDQRNAVVSGISRTVRMGLQIAILGVGALLVISGEMTAGMIFASSILSSRGLQPIDQIIGGWKQFGTTWQAWNNLKAALEKTGNQKQRTLMNNPVGNIAIDNALVISPKGVSAPPILNRINLSIEPGDVVGVVGPSGSGKSTLARLLVGAQTPHSGTVRIDGTDVENWDPAQLGSNVGYLGQEVELLPGTVAQNIARLAQNPDSAAVLEAAQRAQVHELIQNLPQGYDTMLGPGGLGLSGGQRQRVGLARAFYGNPKFMILDEPNANLDDDGEIALQKAMLAARKYDVTMVIITQRKQVLNSVDKILRMHSGNIDFYGSRQDFVDLLRAQRLKAQGRLAANAPQAKSRFVEGTQPQSKPVAPPQKRQNVQPPNMQPQHQVQRNDPLADDDESDEVNIPAFISARG